MANRHVIKGRGKHRGMYLRRRYSRKLDRSVTKWVASQQKATRFDARAPYRQDSYAMETARGVNGYVVKLIAPRALDIRALKDFIEEHAAGAPEKLDCYWIGGAAEIDGIECDAGSNFCLDCAEEKIAEIRASHPKEANEVDIRLDGGWSIDHDNLPRCETCKASLRGSLTDYGIDEELDGKLDHGGPSFNDACGWSSLDDAVANILDDDPRWRSIAKVIAAAQEAERQHEAKLASLAAQPGMAETRIDLLALLAARQEQKAPEPSFRMWAEMKAWLALPREKQRDPDEETAAMEKKLVKEAKRFADLLGYRSYWNCGMFMIDGHHGTYYWPYVVRDEQLRLWNPKAYQEGRAYVLHPCPSGDPKWPHDRDANPYPKGSDEHSQWDSGYMMAITREADCER